MVNSQTMRYLITALILLQLIASEIYSQQWIVPADKQNRLSTFPFNDETRKAGENIYNVNCKSCHGTPGKANFINLVPPPGDPATSKIQINKDGEIFYKVTTGRGPMPSFKSVLSTNEIWNVISFVRSFNSSYKQELMPVINSSAYPGAEIKINLTYNPGDTVITLIAQAVKEKVTVPVTDAAVRLYISRYFGKLQLDEEKITGKNGLAAFRIPDDLPGDTAGNIRLSARFSDEMMYGSVTKDTILCAAEKTSPVSLLSERAMWNNVRKAPVWVILTFSLGLLLVWSFIMLVLLKLRDIFIIGDSVGTALEEDKTH
jgi:mono/diheme cytochrome c family protein